MNPSPSSFRRTAGCARQKAGIDPATISHKAGDFPFFVAESRTVWPLAILDTNGRALRRCASCRPGGEAMACR